MPPHLVCTVAGFVLALRAASATGWHSTCVGFNLRVWGVPLRNGGGKQTTRTTTVLVHVEWHRVVALFCPVRLVAGSGIQSQFCCVPLTPRNAQGRRDIFSRAFSKDSVADEPCMAWICCVLREVHARFYLLQISRFQEQRRCETELARPTTGTLVGDAVLNGSAILAFSGREVRLVFFFVKFRCLDCGVAIPANLLSEGSI